MPRFSRCAAFSVAFLLAVAAVVPAFGAEASWQAIDVTSHDETSRSVMLVTGTLPADASLPAQVSLSAPQGAQLQWAGEILGGDPKDDPEVKPSKTTVDGADIYTFTLAKARMGQIELVMPPAVTSAQGVAASIAWASSQAVPEVRISARVPSGAVVASPVEGASLQPGPEGFSYYTKTFTNVQPGDTPGLAFTYSVPAAPVAATTGSTSSDSMVPLLLVTLLVGAGAALFVVAVTRKMAAKKSVAPGYDPAPNEAIEPDEITSEVEVAVDAEDVSEAQTRGRLNPVTLMVAALGLVVVVAIVVVSQSSKPQLVDGTLSRSFGSASACTSTTLALAPAAGVDLAASGEKLLDSLQGIDGIGLVTLNVENPQMTVEFCESTTNETAIKSALSSSGLVSW